MIPIKANSFKGAFDVLESMMVEAPEVRTQRWQGRDVTSDPSARTHELMNVLMEVPLMGEENLDRYREDCQPNLPWADDHFSERVGGEPLNPGVQWANWPWAASADTFRESTKFNHTYMERLWPKYARTTRNGELADLEINCVRRRPDDGEPPNQGIHWEYGDLWDLVELLAREPDTRQAWMPLFHPDDTGVGDGGRKPCTLGYQFIVREGGLHVYYPLRSCDVARHARDDCYLAVRLLLWVLEWCRMLNPDDWNRVWPGTYLMHATSMHVFKNDWIALRQRRGS